MKFYAKATYKNNVMPAMQLLQSAQRYLQDLIMRTIMLSLNALEDDSGTVAVLQCETLQQAQQFITNYPLHEYFDWEVEPLDGDVSDKFQLNDTDVMSVLSQEIEGTKTAMC